LRQAYDYWQDQPGSFVQFPAAADRIEPQKHGRETKAQRKVNSLPILLFSSFLLFSMGIPTQKKLLA